MAKRISELPAAGEVVDTDELELNQAGTSRKASRAQLVSGLAPIAHSHTVAEIDATGTPDATTFLRGDGTWSPAGGGGGGGAVSSVFGRVGDVTAQPGDYDISEISGAGDLATLDVVGANQIVDGAVRPSKIYGVSAAVPAPVAGVSTIIPDNDTALHVALNPAITHVKIQNPSAGRRLAISNATGHPIDVLDEGDLVIRAGVPNRYVVDLNRTGSVWSFLVEYAARLHQHPLTDISGAGALAGKNTVASVDIDNGAVIDSKIADGAVGPTKLAATAVTPGSYTNANITVDQQGRITSASDGDPGGAGSSLEVLDEGVSLQTEVAAINFIGDGISAAWNAAESRVDVTVAGGSAPVGSVFGRTGAVVAQADDYSADQITETASAKIMTGDERTKLTTYPATAGALAGKSIVGTTDIDDSAVTNPKIGSQAVTASKIGASAVTSTRIADNAVATAKIQNDAVTTVKLGPAAVTSAKIANGAVGPAQLENTAVTPGSYTHATLTVDQQGRITAASSGAPGEANTASNVGTAGVGVFNAKVGVDLRFRNIAPAGNKVSVSLSGQNIALDVVEANLAVPASAVVGLAPVATVGTLASLSSLNANGGTITNYRIGQDSVAGAYTFVQTDSGREKIFTGASPQTWTVPVLNAGTQVIVHNLGTAAVTFSPNGVVLKGLTAIAADKTASLSWLPGNVVKLTGELA